MERIERLLEKPRAYNNVDGVGELSTGLMTLGFAFLQWMQVHTPGHSAWNSHYAMWIFLAVVGGAIHYGAKAIKERITYPRTGFVEYQKPAAGSQLMAAGMGAAVASAIALFVAVRSRMDLTTPLSFMGLVLAAFYAHGFARTVPWKWAVSGVLAVGSIAIAVLPLTLVGPLARGSSVSFPPKIVAVLWLNFMLFGTAVAISGDISFWLYLRRTRGLARDTQ